MQNFQRLASDLPVAALSDRLRRNDDLWSQFTARQSYEGSAHKDTEAIFLRWCRGQTVSDAFTEIQAIDYPAYERVPEARQLVDLIFAKTGARELGRVLIVTLKPRGRITTHVDEGAYADHFERFHAVIEAETGNAFFCGAEMAEMRTGELWFFDHKQEHWVYNGSDKPRVHLIVDVVAPDFRRERHAISA